MCEILRMTSEGGLRSKVARNMLSLLAMLVREKEWATATQITFGFTFISRAHSFPCIFLSDLAISPLFLMSGASFASLCRIPTSAVPSSSSVLLKLHQRPGGEEQDLLHPGQHVRWYMWREPCSCYPWQHVQEHVSGHPGHHCHWHKQITLETCDLSIA